MVVVSGPSFAQERVERVEMETTKHECFCCFLFEEYYTDLLGSGVLWMWMCSKSF